LRLNDLPAGYLKLDLQEEQGERVFCSRLHHVEDTPAEIARLVDRFHPKGCIGTYYRLYSVPGQSPGPLVVGTGVLAMDNDEAADAAWGAVPELLARLMSGRKPRPVPVSEEIGAATELFHARKTPRFYPIYRKVGAKASFLVWRSGHTLATIMVIGESFADIDSAAVELARRQQKHIRNPTRYTLAERFDGEVPLDDPAVDIPVYWLGRNFRPGGDLPNNRLFDSYFTGKAGPETHDGFAEGPNAPLNIRYTNIRLATWTPATWSVFASSETGKAITRWKCTQTRTVALPEGTATIFGGYKKNFTRCPKEAPRAFTAWVDIGGVKVVVNAPFAADFIEVVNPYGSFEGMEAIVRSLTRRSSQLPSAPTQGW
jgi:O-acetyl-ADP-ribose deacetylase (regulator of RNase III)